MGFIDYFPEWATITMTRLNYGRTYNATTGVFGPEGYSADDTPVTFTGGLWRGSGSEQYVSEQFREELTDVFATDYTTGIPADCRLTDGTDTWAVLDRDNVGYQNDLYIIALKKVNNAG